MELEEIPDKTNQAYLGLMDEIDYKVKDNKLLLAMELLVVLLLTICLLKNFTYNLPGAIKCAEHNKNSLITVVFFEIL